MTDRVLILQTSDGARYKPLLDATEAHHRAYARRRGYDYARFDGVKRGAKPWHAAFNRIYLLQDLLKAREYDWVLYMDADAVVVDPARGVERFLDDSKAFVACRGATDDPRIWYNVNNGVAFFNMRHPATPGILDAWRRLYERVPMAVLEAEPEGVFDDVTKHVNDQDMLSAALVRTPALQHAIKVYRGEEHNAFNYHGPFIQQILRAEVAGLEARLRKLRQLVATAAALLH